MVNFMPRRLHLQNRTPVAVRSETQTCNLIHWYDALQIRGRKERGGGAGGMVEGRARLRNENMKNHLPMNLNGRLSSVNALTESPVRAIFSSHLVRTPFIANAFIHVSLEPFYPVTWLIVIVFSLRINTWLCGALTSWLLSFMWKMYYHCMRLHSPLQQCRGQRCYSVFHFY